MAYATVCVCIHVRIHVCIYILKRRYSYMYSVGRLFTELFSSLTHFRVYHRIIMIVSHNHEPFFLSGPAVRTPYCVVLAFCVYTRMHKFSCVHGCQSPLTRFSFLVFIVLNFCACTCMFVFVLFASVHRAVAAQCANFFKNQESCQHMNFVLELVDRF
jgi:hypothetical protein